MKKNKYLSNEAISKLDNLQSKAKKVVEGFIVGLHKSPYHGFSVEFSDHRSYGPGDEIRHIDWKLWGKTDRFFVKRYEKYAGKCDKGGNSYFNLECNNTVSQRHRARSRCATRGAMFNQVRPQYSK